MFVKINEEMYANSMHIHGILVKENAVHVMVADKPYVVYYKTHEEATEKAKKLMYSINRDGSKIIV